MASRLNPYISFEGTARQALEFYKSVFGGELSVIQQNLETSSTDVREMEGKRVRLVWRPDVEFVIKEGST